MGFFSVTQLMHIFLGCILYFLPCLEDESHEMELGADTSSIVKSQNSKGCAGFKPQWENWCQNLVTDQDLFCGTGKIITVIMDGHVNGNQEMLATSTAGSLM
jgi:hypothetical protein